jgi:predicted ATPase
MTRRPHAAPLRLIRPVEITAMARLLRLDLAGWKTVQHLDGFEPGPITLLIGPNGAGKSNLISFFRLLSWMTGGSLQEHVRSIGGANAVLHDGAARTPHLAAHLVFEQEGGRNEYAFRLDHVAGDTLAFGDERYRFCPAGAERDWLELGSSQIEARLIDAADGGDGTARALRGLLRRCVVHQFHNTSATARMRQRWQANDGRYLKEDAANLASFLLRLQTEEPRYYRRIVATLGQIAPFFADFELEPTNGTLLLQWRERGSDLVFHAGQASDGTLRTMALISLLLQPERDLPAVLILDEPELGLHPSAIGLLAGMVRAASAHCQVVIATQSAGLLDYFAAPEVVVCERDGRASRYRKLDEAGLSEWLAAYSLSELWEKNVLGGKP